jgi:hypothetical protein
MRHLILEKRRASSDIGGEPRWELGRGTRRAGSGYSVGRGEAEIPLRLPLGVAVCA